MQTFKTS